MTRTLSLFLVALLALSLAACDRISQSALDLVVGDCFVEPAAEDEVPLSWSINSRDRERLLAGMDRGRNVEERARLRQRWVPARDGRPSR